MDSRLVQDSSMAVKESPDIFEKCLKFTKAKELMSYGLYPYFRVIESAQDPEVIINGKRMIMVGSNNYLGLTNHPKVKDAAIEAVRNTAQKCAIPFPERHTRYTCGPEDKLARFMRRSCACIF